MSSAPTRGTCFFFLFIPLNTLLTLNHLWLKLYNPPVILMFLVGTILKMGLKHICVCVEPSFGGFNYFTDTVGKVLKKHFLCAKRTPKRHTQKLKCRGNLDQGLSFFNYCKCLDDTTELLH